MKKKTSVPLQDVPPSSYTFWIPKQIKKVQEQKSQTLMILIKRHAYTTLVSNEDIGGDSPSLTRDGVRRIRSPEQLKRCSALI